MLVKSPTHLALLCTLVAVGLFASLYTIFSPQPTTVTPKSPPASTNETLIAEIRPIPHTNETELRFVTPTGTVVKIFSLQELGQSPTDTFLRSIKQSEELFWFQAQLAQHITAIIRIDPTDWSVETFHLDSAEVLSCDFSFHPPSRQFVYGDFCPLDTLDVQDAAMTKRPHSLYSYDLATNKKQALITLYSYEPFAPVWINATSVEYTDPNKTERQVTSL